MTVDEMTIPQQLKDLIEAQYEGQNVVPLFFSWGEGLWEATLVINGKAVRLSGFYATDDWRIEEEEM